MTARLVSWRELAPDVRHFVFEAPDVEKLDFQPGQFVSLSHPIGGKTITRAYSLSGVPDGNRFELCLNRVADGLFSPHLFAMSPGESVSMKGPLGTFVWRDRDREAFLVATGTGIAPMRGMLLDELAREGARTVTLLFGARYPHGLLYRHEFEEMAAAHSRLRFVPTVTRPDETWTGRTGRVQPHLLEMLGDRMDVDVYICGLADMVNDTRALLKERGFDRKQVIVEKFD
jgi:CDP-4-dehydro-6-deoxyglucose reductase